MVKHYASRFAAGTESYRELSECFQDEPDRGTEYVLASDYAALEAQRDKLAEALREIAGGGWNAVIEPVALAREVLTVCGLIGGKDGN